MTEAVRERLGSAFSMLSIAAVAVLLGVLTTDRMYLFAAPFGLMGLFSIGLLLFSTRQPTLNNSTENPEEHYPA